MEQRLHGRSGLKPVAVFRFPSEDWSPWIALARMGERWPALRFDLTGAYLEYSRTFSRAAHGIAARSIETRCVSSGTSVQSTHGKLR